MTDSSPDRNRDPENGFAGVLLPAFLPAGGVAAEASHGAGLRPEPSIVALAWQAALGLRPGAAPGPGQVAAHRITGVLTALLLIATCYAWLTPFVTQGNAGLPFGCGSLAHPNGTPFGRQVCLIATQAHTVLLIVLIATTIVLALAAALLSTRSVRWLAGVFSAVPVLAAALVVLLSPLQVQGSDGNAVSCGRPVRPAADRFSRGLCADVPGGRLATGLTLGLAGLMLGIGVPYAAAAQVKGRR